MVETVECDNPYWSQTEAFFLSKKGIQTGKQKKLWVCSKVCAKCAMSKRLRLCYMEKARCGIGDHIESCSVDEHLAYKLEKRRRWKNETRKKQNLFWSFMMKQLPPRPPSHPHPAFCPFLNSHDIQDNKRHILAFAMVIGLLVAMRTWDTDGTFKVVPQWCQQLFTIHAFVAALINKAAVLMANINRQTIICDFETALIPAIQGYFLNTRVQCCYFLICKAVH
ncbi:hypothetical protein T4D_16474 [Trichinella pseudospiralis]|uniref:MULE transposase domain-containing protein n=1 Tax=Trichinella pseudospiralis TaxID=6337 RepID=A0A0V1F4D4_TRIPS|nr:hypothetical protein T4D_16474 [Trichinella pseudospiralis]